jgi:hypothetical protein
LLHCQGRRAHDDGLLLLVPAREPSKRQDLELKRSIELLHAVAAELHGASELLFLCTKLL